MSQNGVRIVALTIVGVLVLGAGYQLFVAIA